MREKYQTLSLAILRDLAKARNLKGVSGLKKAELIDRMVQADEEDKKKAAKPQAKEEPASKTTPGNSKSEDQREALKRSIAQRKARVEAESSKLKEEVPSASGAEAGENKERRNRPVNNRSENRRDESRSDNRSDNRGESRNDNRSEDRGESRSEQPQEMTMPNKLEQLDSGEEATGILEIMTEGYGFIRSSNYMPGPDDVYVSPSQIRKFNLKTGDILCGNTRIHTPQEKFRALLYLKHVNGKSPFEASKRPNFEDMTPVFPDGRIRLEVPGSSVAMRIVDLIAPIGKGQRGMIVSPPKAGKTTLLKETALSVRKNNPEVHMIILLIDERPEEVTDIKEAIEGDNVEVIYSTFDELPEHHKRVSEMTIERAKRLVEQHEDVMILLDSITRLARAYNLTCQPSGRTLSGGLDPAAMYMPKRFFGAARNMREGGSLTVLATALVETGSKMDDVVYEEFKGTGNMELVLDRRLSERRVFPAIDIPKSGTRREDLLLTKEEQEAVYIMRRAINGSKSEESVQNIIDYFVRTENNKEFIKYIKRSQQN
ncbi:MAG: transcription termination factor Rho [Clostridiales bacterium]|nr:transcription termination factor Rho [Clostridiales bacterium]